MVLERGALLNNRYRIVEILGQGGMGSVYRAIDENLGVEVAVKDNLFTTEEYARQFRREAVILANLRHPNLPRVTDHFVIEGQGQYLVMDYIDGEDLRQRMDRLGLLPEDDVVAVGASLCDALSYLASRTPAIVHRDLKPGNVKITPQGQIFLVDFGLAKMVLGSQITTTGARAMTPGYSPPEQYGTARTDQRSDIFSLGATLYAALTGAIPEDGLGRAMDQSGLTPIRKHNSHISRRLAAVIEKALAVRPDDRYQTAEEFKLALLAARGSIRRKTGEYKVEPPPESKNGGSLPGEILDDNLAPDTPIERTPIPALSSIPLEEYSSTGYSKPIKGQANNALLVLTLVIFFLIAGSGAALFFNPNIPAQALSMFWPATPTIPLVLPPEPTSTWTPTPTETESDPPAVSLPGQAPTETITPSPSLEPAEVITPTATATPEPTPMAGSAEQIAFASERTDVPQVYLINLDGTGLTQITDMPEGACQPAWSPDGRQFVFVSPCGGNWDVYPGAALFLINADGSGLTPLASAPGGDFDPSWSPDGENILFTSIRDGGRPRIYKYHLEDNSVTRLSDEYLRDMQASWSPDGKEIVFVTTRKGPYQVWVMNAYGGSPHLFSHSKGKANSYPVFSPDGKVILYTQAVERGGIPYLFMASVEEEGVIEYPLTQDPIPMREGKYSPDGLWIVMEAWPKGKNHDIYIMAANGAGRRPITEDIFRDYDPAWRPMSALAQ